MSGVIYMFTFPNGKRYIGLTKLRFHKRLATHKYNSNKDDPKLAVHRAWKKYGKPIVKILAIVTDEELVPSEIRAIKVFRSFGKDGYNMTPGGEVSPMLIPEIVEKVRALAKTPARIARNREIHSGSKRSLESKKRISESLKGKQLGVPKTLAHRMKISESNKGKKSFAGRQHTVETRLKMSESARNRSEETRLRMSEAAKARWAKKDTE